MPELSSNQQAQRLSIYIGESDRWRGAPLHLAILEALRGAGLAGATVLRAAAGFGAHSRIHTTSIEVLSIDLPILIETIDTPDKIAAALEIVGPMVQEGLITLEDVHVVKYTHRFLNPLPADRLVSDVMTRAVAALSPEHSLAEAWQQMLEKALKAMPVVDANRRVIGILTDEDLMERAGLLQRLSIALRMESDDLGREIQSIAQSPLTVAAVMTHPVLTVSENETLGHAVSKMVRAGLKRLPVVNSSGRLSGMLSRLDVLRQVAGSTQAAPPPHLPTGSVRTVQEIMAAVVPTVRQSDSISTVIEEFARFNSNRLIVIDQNGTAVGLISDSDVVARIQPGQRLGILAALRQKGSPPVSRQTAADLMSPHPLTAPPDLPITTGIQQMVADGRKWLVVVDPAGKPLGLVDRQIALEALNPNRAGK